MKLSDIEQERYRAVCRDACGNVVCIIAYEHGHGLAYFTGEDAEEEWENWHD